MIKEKVKEVGLKKLAKDSGVNYEVFRIKRNLVKLIRSHCDQTQISQRSLAKLVPGLTQDRVSKVFSGQVGGMTIDKLIQILDCLNIKVNITPKKAA
jgi:predicted XRE-type DNA-binding protein